LSAHIALQAGRPIRKIDHPTKKPVDRIRLPILNHTKRGEPIYAPFLDSGSTLAAAELTARVC
jgi:DNA modification methylase